MKRFTLGRPSLSRTFALLSLGTIALITFAQATVQSIRLREDLVEWERKGSATIHAHVQATLHESDFERWTTPEAQGRFRALGAAALADPEVIRVKVYDPNRRVVWSDEARLVGVRFPDNRRLDRAIGGETVAHLEHVDADENIYERGYREVIELYVPVRSGEASRPPGPVIGVVEVYKNPTDMFAHMTRDRMTIIATSVAGALVLYAALFGIVHRASRQIVRHEEDLHRQSDALRTANAELEAMHGELRAKERLATIGEVSAAVAHGIRNPLANIRASTQIALETLDSEPSLRKYLGAVVHEVDRLDRWLKALLDVVRPFEPRLALVDVNAVVEEVLAVLRERIARGGIPVERDLASLPRLLADEAQLLQAVLAVVENALDAVARGGAVTVRTRPAGDDGVSVDVVDTGPGMPPARARRAFEPFYTTKSQGTGLGLAITRKIVEGHGGHVAIASEPGCGTTVTITLPLRRTAPAPHATRGSATPDLRPAPRTA